MLFKPYMANYFKLCTENPALNFIINVKVACNMYLKFKYKGSLRMAIHIKNIIATNEANGTIFVSIMVDKR